MLTSRNYTEISFYNHYNHNKKNNYDDDNADRTIAASSWFWGLEKQNDTEKKGI